MLAGEALPDRTTALVERAATLQRRATAKCDRSRFDLAERDLSKALTLLADPDIVAAPDAVSVKVRVLLTLSTVEVEVRGRGGGLGRLADARRLADQLGRPSVTFAVDNATALRMLRTGDHPAAMQRFEAAERHIAAAGTTDACVLYLNRGNLHLQRLELDQARRDLDRCVRLAAQETDGAVSSNSVLTDLEFMARHNLGYLEFLAGNLPRSLQLMDEAAAMPVGVSLGISALDKARVLLEAGLTDAADQTLVAAEHEFRRGRLHQELAETELARADCAVMSHNLRAARTLAGSARTRFKRRGNDRWRRVADLTLLSADLADGRPASFLIGPAIRLASEFSEQGLELQARIAELIACAALVAAGRLEEATRRFAGLTRMSRSDPIGVRLQQRAVAATLLKGSGERTRARREVHNGLTELSRHQAQFGSIDLQTASAIHGRELVNLDLELALAHHRPATLFNAVERGRAVSRRLTAVTPPAGESADLLAEVRQLTEIIKVIGDDPAARADVAAMRQRTSALYDQLSAISWRAVGIGEVVHPSSMAEVASAVEGHHKVLVSYVQFRGQWAAVLIGAGQPRLVRLPGDDSPLELARRAQADLNVLAYVSLPTAMRRAVTASVTNSLERLDQLLIGPLGLTDQSLAIIPTGPTATLPWNCLPSLRGRPVEVAPTATSWLAGTLAVDNVGPVAVESFSGPGLHAATDEAARVAELWVPHARSSRAHLGVDATRDRLSEALATSTVVHVAAHGSHMKQNPLFSSLELADGPLFAYEIADRQVAPHVILSACELGQATTRPGDEALGLARVLLQLGSQCVVAGVAQVADDQAGQVMADYHTRLAAGDDSATALAAATATGPYVPFICFGSSWRAVEAPIQATQRAARKPILR